MFALLFRGFFLLGIISCYSMSVWKLIDGYFRNEYKQYLSDEMKRHPRLRSEIEPATGASSTTQLPPTENEIVDFKLAPNIATGYDDSSTATKVIEMSAKACNHREPERDSCQIGVDEKESEMDYDNHHRPTKQEMSERPKTFPDEEEAHLSYWLSQHNRVTTDHLYCDVAEEVNCSDN